MQQAVDTAVESLVPLPKGSQTTGSLFDFLLHAFLHTIKLAKISAIYRTGQAGVKCVVYIPATTPPLVFPIPTVWSKCWVLTYSILRIAVWGIQFGGKHIPAWRTPSLQLHPPLPSSPYQVSESVDLPDIIFRHCPLHEVPPHPA